MKGSQVLAKNDLCLKCEFSFSAEILLNYIDSLQNQFTKQNSHLRLYLSIKVLFI